MSYACPVCDRELRLEPPPLPGNVGVCRVCRSPLYFGPDGWRVLEDHELAELKPASRVLLEILITGMVDA